MIQTKRYLNDDESSDDNTKKLQKTFDNNGTITCLEGLSNEIFYEIFEYLDGCQLYEAFSNLNQRCQNLLSCLPFSLKINLRHRSEETFQGLYTGFVIPNRNKIISLSLPRYSLNDFIKRFQFDSSFIRLEALALHSHEDISFTKFTSFLRLLSLPRLVSLTTFIDHNIEKINSVYRTMFKLPMLKYIKISCNANLYMDLSITTNGRFSSVEHLVIDHLCSFETLIHILSYTPRLRRLSCKGLDICLSSNVIKEVIIPMNLTHISLKNIDAEFNDLEEFILTKTPQLQVLRIGFFQDVTCLDANRWERLISQHLTNLRTLEFKSEVRSRQNVDISQDNRLIHGFKSSFWIERKWLLKLYIYVDSAFASYDIIYSILTDRQDSNEFLNNTGNDENTFINSADNYGLKDIHPFDKFLPRLYTVVDEMDQLTILDHLKTNPYILFTIIRFSLTKLKLTCLNILGELMCIEQLIGLIKYLPNLDSLAISSLATIRFEHLSDNILRNLRLVSANNKISKVKLRRMEDLAQSQILLSLCPSMRYFETDCANDVTPDIFIRTILMKNTNENPYLSSLFLHISPDDKYILEILKKMIDNEHLCQNYTIKQKENRIYLRWNL